MHVSKIRIKIFKPKWIPFAVNHTYLSAGCKKGSVQCKQHILWGLTKINDMKSKYE